MNRSRRTACVTPLLLALMDAAGAALCLTRGMEAGAAGWTAATVAALAWLARELDPRR